MNLEDDEPKFCAKCGQRLVEPSIFQRLQGIKTYFEFKEGCFCVGCARDKVKKVRNKK